jgi:hypothetical protein
LGKKWAIFVLLLVLAKKRFKDSRSKFTEQSRIHTLNFFLSANNEQAGLS